MRIGLDARTIDGLTGIAQYGRALTERLTNNSGNDEFVIFDREQNKFPVLTAHFSDRQRFVKAKLDLLHVLGGAPPLEYLRPYVLTVHDLIIYKHPEWFPEGQWFSLKFSYPSAIKHARKIIVPSVSTKNDLIELFKVKENKIVVIPHGVDLRNVLTADKKEKEKYILSLGTIEPRKNIITIVRAYRAMVDKYPELKSVELRLAGNAGWKSDEIIDEIRKTQCEGYRISMLGAVTEDEKWQLLAGASALVFPSLYEGFGMPILEAFASGVPVISANNSSLPEACNNSALLAHAQNTDEWVSAMHKILVDDNLANDLRSKGLATAGDASWEKTAKATLEVYHSL